MRTKSLFRSLRKSQILIAVREPQDALTAIDSNVFQRQIFCLLKKTEGERGPGRLALQLLKQHLQKRAACPRMCAVSSVSAFTQAVKEGVCIVDFYTRWFPLTSQRLQELDGLTKGLCPRATVVMVDLDAAPQLTMQLSIVVLPTLLVYANGILRGRCVGGQTRRQLKGILGSSVVDQELGESGLV